MTQSFVAGVEGMQKRLSAYDAAVRRRLDEVVREGALRMQQELVARVPVASGTLRKWLADSTAVSLKPSTSGLTATVGFLSAQARKECYYAAFVEYGTKSYVAGQHRRAGKDKRGRQRTQRMKRAVPSRPAHPFFRPAFAAVAAHLKGQRARAHLLAAMEAGFSS